MQQVCGVVVPIWGWTVGLRDEPGTGVGGQSPSLLVAFQSPQRTCILSTSSLSALCVLPTTAFLASACSVSKLFSVFKTSYADSSDSRVEGHLSSQLDSYWKSTPCLGDIRDNTAHCHSE